ncbi:hypothetical protein HELRODRAFT_63151, partial [Helobdella robusta]|uniref:EGF-like domain-containing protein n=1 Tax=Helobdella robusta TaxID=6412 RepID=T1FXB6_HELRO
CSHICENVPGSFKCRCREGFELLSDNKNCKQIDINECLEGRKCRDNEICTNTKGSYLCVKLQNSSCSLGFYFNNVTKKCEDFNECMTALENCPMGMKCINTHGSYTCKRARECGTGYKLNTVTDECEDIDECVLNIHNCGKSRTCKNIAGSFRCLTTDCAKGHKFSEIFQVYVDECLKIPQICPQKKVCKNTYGSYKCVDEMVCPAGFFLNETKNGCLDINECGTSLHSCTYKNMLCNNTIGSYICYCPSGTETNKVLRECVDINECTQKISACSAHTTCENTFGSYRCVCRDGFRLEGNECKDDNECARKETCQHICTNVWGSFRCSCKPGYKLAADNRSCQDLDECKIYSLMKGKEACRYNCTNEVGSFNCSCPPGYHMTSNFKCVDIDECNKAVKPCDNNKICINLKGSFKCEETDCGSFYNRNVKEDSTKLCNKKTCNRGDSRCLSSPFVIQYFFLSFSTDIPIPYAITQLTMPQDSANLFQSKLTNFKSSIQKPYLGSVDKNYFQLTKSYFQVTIFNIHNDLRFV